jgi:hypothetical protein
MQVRNVVNSAQCDLMFDVWIELHVYCCVGVDVSCLVRLRSVSPKGGTLC